MKKKIFKALFIGFIIGVLAFLGVKYVPTWEWYKNLTAKKAPPVTAVDIVKDFLVSDSLGNAKYAGSQIEVTGVVKESKIENGKTTILLASNDSTTGVYFVLKDSIALIDAGKQVTIKGNCSGHNIDVEFNEGVIVK